jgi:hypothetical protein
MVGVQIDKYQTIDLEIDSISPKHLDNILWRLEAFKKGVIPIILQPGDAVVKQFIFRTKSWLFFTPLTHTLQIQVRHGVDDRDHLNTVPYELSVQSALTATMVGAVLGGTVGGVARLLSELQSGNMNVGTQIISLILAVILSAIAVVSFARKSGAQQIVSIEDFWGGLFLGFLIGFLGQNYALDLIVRSQDIVDTRCSQDIVDISARCSQHIVDIGHTHLNLGGESCPATHDRIKKRPNVAAWR